MQTQGANQMAEGLFISHYNKTRELDLKALKDATKLNGATCDFANQIIDFHEGFVINCYGGRQPQEGYHFTYQLDNMTTVDGQLPPELNTAVQPFLNSLHVIEVG
jgi:hypothetical protein